MASKLGMNTRKAAAQDRLNASLPKLVDTLKLELPPYPSYRNDPDREAAERMEWTADAIDAMLAALPAVKPAKTKVAPPEDGQV